MNITTKILEEMGACLEAVEYWKSHTIGSKTLEEIIKGLHRGDWLLRLLIWTKTINQRQAVKLACVSARRALKYVKNGEDCPKNAIIAAERWSDEPTEVNRRIAADAAAAACASGNAAVHVTGVARADSYSKYAAAAAARAAARAAVYAIDAISYAAEAARAAAYYAADADVDVTADAYAYANATSRAFYRENKAIADTIREEMKKSSFQKLAA